MIDESYCIPVDKTGWELQDGSGDVRFTWSYDNGRENLLNLYSKGKRRQWDAEDRIDWSLEIDPENPLHAPEELIPIYGTEMWDKMTPEEKGRVRRHMVAWHTGSLSRMASLTTTRQWYPVPGTPVHVMLMATPVPTRPHCRITTSYMTRCSR